VLPGNLVSVRGGGEIELVLRTAAPVTLSARLVPDGGAPGGSVLPGSAGTIHRFALAPEALLAPFAIQMTAGEPVRLSTGVVRHPGLARDGRILALALEGSVAASSLPALDDIVRATVGRDDATSLERVRKIVRGRRPRLERALRLARAVMDAPAVRAEDRRRALDLVNRARIVDRLLLQYGSPRPTRGKNKALRDPALEKAMVAEFVGGDRALGELFSVTARGRESGRLPVWDRCLDLKAFRGASMDLAEIAARVEVSYKATERVAEDEQAGDVEVPQPVLEAAQVLELEIRPRDLDWLQDADALWVTINDRWTLLLHRGDLWPPGPQHPGQLVRRHRFPAALLVRGKNRFVARRAFYARQSAAEPLIKICEATLRWWIRADPGRR
jgi:hypothetical protein